VKGASRKENFAACFSKFVSDERSGPFFSICVVLIHLLNTFVVKNPFAQVPLGLAAVFFVPGYLWLDVLSGKLKIAEKSERLVTAIALSICLVMLSVAGSSLILKLPLTKETTVLIVSAVSLAGIGARKAFLGKSIL
jgi:uncharacterized membrane protein